MRPICSACRRNPAAVNYKRNNKTHYRTRCNACIRLGRQQSVPVPRWRRAGYEKKAACDLCHFKSQYSSQIVVVHVDGDLNNVALLNLRSVCLNCLEVIKRRRVTWRIGEIEADR